MRDEDPTLIREAQIIALALGIGSNMTPAALRSATVKELMVRHGIDEELATDIADRAVDDLAAKLPKVQ